MKSEQSTSINVMVKEGHMTLASWTQDFASVPTIGERIQIGRHWDGKPAEYADEAVVSKVSLDTTGHQQVIEATPECSVPANKRPTVLLNADLVQESLRCEVEDYLRGQLQLPVLDWERSHETRAIVRIHPAAPEKPSLDALETGIREILKQHSELAYV